MYMRDTEGSLCSHSAKISMADAFGSENAFSPSQEFNLHLSNESKSPLNRSKRSLQFSPMEGS